MDEYDDRDFECSNRECYDTDSSDDEQLTKLELERDNQKIERVHCMAALF